MQNIIKIILAILVAITAVVIVFEAADSVFFKELFDDSRVHSLDLEKYRSIPRQ